MIDEAQNLTEKEIITTITRIGPNTKVFICGDDMQSDIGNKSGFTQITRLFQMMNQKSKELDALDLMKMILFVVN